MKNKKNIHTSLSSYCTEYISNFNLHQLNLNFKRNALKAAAIAATSSFALSSTDAQAQVLDCPPVFEEIPLVGGPVTNPNGLSDINDRNSAPTFVDYDGDGDFDVVTGDGFSAFGATTSGAIYLFTNTGTNTNPIWTGPTVNPNGLGGNNINPSYGVLSPEFVDIDADGDLDAFIGTEYDGTLYFENVGSATAPNYNLVGTNQFGILDRENATPDFADIDGDGDFDLFIGNFPGNTSFFRNDGTATAPNFVFVSDNPGGIVDVGSYAAPTLADLDGDGDLDMMIGDTGGGFNYFENTGSSTAPNFGAQQVNPFGLSAVADDATPDFQDIDNDGDLDMITGSDESQVYFENIGTATNPVFQRYPFGLTPLSGEYNAIDYADMDADGDIDFLVGNKAGEVQYYENVGTATQPDFLPAVTLFGYGGAVEQLHPTLGDIDGDGDIDLMWGSSNIPAIFFVENIGTPQNFNFALTAFGNSFGLTGTADVQTPEFVDLDNDGDLDIVAGGANLDGGLYFQNTGTTTAPNFAAPVPLAGVTGYYNRFSEFDADGDGDFDLIAGNIGDITYYQNIGTPAAPSFVDRNTSLGLINPNTTNETDFSPTIVDIDQDGRFEGFVGNKGENLYVFTDKKVIPAISIVETAPLLSCESNTLSISSSNVALGDLTVTWYDGNNNVVGTGTTITLPSLDSDTYSAKAVVTATGCESNQPTINVVRQNPVISITQGSQIFSCETNTLSVSSSNFALSDLTIRWYDSNNNQVATGDTFTLSSLSTETYSVRATSPTGCDSNEPTVDVIQNLPIISIVEGSTVNSCEVSTISVASSNFALSDLTLEWLVNGNVVGTGATYTLPSTDAQTYTVRATTSTGCQVTASTRTVKDTPNILVTQGTSVFSCQPVTLTVESSNYLLSDLNFTWYDSDGNTVGTGTSLEVDPLALPNYGPKEVSVVATSATGCESNTFNVSVACSDQVSITLSGTAGYNTANLTWHTTGSRPVREYEVYGDPGQFGQYLLFGYSLNTSYEVVGLTNGQKVDFKVRPIYVDGDYGTYSNTVTVKPSIVLGEEDEQKAGFAFFPNPNNGEFSLKLQDGSTSASVSVVSLSGQQVYTTTLSNTQTSINLGNVASGMYIVRVETAQGIYQQKVSVVR
ncbi:FG-GAP-like repeat-containing protein [Bernardetia sp.]|uniref:FG-GAP-like repeat-containing protein n=1 Tax=Bernardetia sp. TaxID=1937974 RepID=UPI0025C6EA3F|nr:FG-GAP-like repeat-containing protein [Bernardetia sp.]